MNYAILKFEEEIRREISRILDMKEVSLEIPAKERGDYALPCFSFASHLKKSPVDIATYLAKECRLERGTVKKNGPYLNFEINNDYLVENTIKNCFEMRGHYGSFEPIDKNIIVEHTSANPNGPLHVGRARNPIIGDTIARIFDKMGYRVETQFYVDDIGRQVAILSWGIANLKESDLPECEREKIDHKLVGYYQKANKLMEENESVVDGIRKLMKSIEEGDEETITSFTDNSKKVLAGMKESLERLGITHDTYKTESSLILDGSVDEVLESLEDLESCEREENALYFEHGNHKIFLTRGDGTSLYPLRDVAYHIWKAKRADELIDVLGEDHKVHGTVIQNVLDVLGIKPIPDIIYHSFVSFDGQRMSTRKGAYVTLDDMMDLAHERALDEVLKRRDDLSKEEADDIAEMVGMGAVRYNIIRVQPEKPMDFRWEEALNFQGNSAPFIQYAYARAASILRKWGGDHGELLSKGDISKLTEPGEIELIRKIALFPREIKNAAVSEAPHLMANYAYELGAMFNQFYRDHPVLNADVKKYERLALVKASKIAIGNALYVLGIKAPEYM